MVLKENDLDARHRLKGRLHSRHTTAVGALRRGDGAPCHTQGKVDVYSGGAGWRSADGKLLRNSKAGAGGGLNP